MSTYFVENFGCRATQADGAALERQFEQQGLSRASTPAEASLVVMNTCTVTAAADQDARAAIRRVQRQNPDVQIVVTGCYAQRAPKEVAALPGVSLVIGNSHKHQLVEIVSTKILASDLRPQTSDPAFVPLAMLRTPSTSSDPQPETEPPLSSAQSEVRRPRSEVRGPASLRRPTTNDQRPIFVSDIFAHTELQAAPVFDAIDGNENARTRPNLKVQDGCDNRCSFCVIPYVRGQSRSLPTDRILRELNTLINSGYREVVISGINLGRWGRDLAVTGLGQRPLLARPERSEGTNDQRLTSLIRTILSETTLEKLRISSVEPMDWTDELISVVASSPRIAKHAHVPMQSGSDAVLRRMHRKYRPWHYRNKIEKIHAAMPTAAIGADVMVGFPGETEAEFQATRRMIDDLPFTYLHVFTYSPRPGTPAASMPNQVPVHTARERNRILRDLADQKKQAFMRTFIGQQLEAITLNSSCGAGTLAREGSATEPANRFENAVFTEALTDNYLKLHLRGHHPPNHWLRVRIEGVEAEALAGQTVS